MTIKSFLIKNCTKSLVNNVTLICQKENYSKKHKVKLSDIYDVLNLLRNFYFKKLFSFEKLLTLVELSAIDNINRKNINCSGRFTVFYILNSLVFCNIIFIYYIHFLREENQFFPSLVKIYDSANWAERECWDMFGLTFIGNNNLRRILTDYGFKGFPLRKDFPVIGFVEVEYDDEFLQLVTKNVSLAQELRLYHFQNL